MAQVDRSEPMDDTPEPQRGGWWFVVIPALTLIVGLVLGGLIVGVTDVGSEPEAQPTATSSPSPGGPSPSQDVTVVVPRECLEAAETVQDATELIRDGASAIRDFRPDELITLLDELEDLDAVAREQAATCEETDVSSTP